mgnify:CR=1 FL=1
MIKLTIDGKQFEADGDKTILNVCRENGIEIPTLCYLEKINEIGSCRLCVVEVEGLEKLVTACNTKVKEGMEVRTNTERVRRARENTLHLLMAEHKTNCFKCLKNGACELQYQASTAWMSRTSSRLTTMCSTRPSTSIPSSPTIRGSASSASAASAPARRRRGGTPSPWREMRRGSM